MIYSTVPGILGNQLEGKLNKTTAPHYMCEKHTDDYVTLWLAVTDLLPDGEVDCLSDNLRSVGVGPVVIGRLGSGLGGMLLMPQWYCGLARFT